MTNLLSNAVKYSSQGSGIVVRGSRDGDVVRLSVKDEGIGIAPHMLDRVFEPFVQEQQPLDRAVGGLGLGLAIVRNIVRAHGGTVHAHSDGSDRGAEFIIELPAAEHAKAGIKTSEEPASPPVTGAQKRILVVDDNVDSAEILRTALEHLDHVVDVAMDGPSALSSAASFQPSVVLLDIGLPIMDGYEVARQLRNADNALGRVHLIALTGYGQEADRQRAHDAGFHHHLVKPIDLERLRRILSDTR